MTSLKYKIVFVCYVISFNIFSQEIKDTNKIEKCNLNQFEIFIRDNIITETSYKWVGLETNREDIKSMIFYMGFSIKFFNVDNHDFRLRFNGGVIIELLKNYNYDKLVYLGGGLEYNFYLSKSTNEFFGVMIDGGRGNSHKFDDKKFWNYDLTLKYNRDFFFLGIGFNNRIYDQIYSYVSGFHLTLGLNFSFFSRYKS